MLIRNARLRGWPCPTDLRLMHGAVQEMGTGLIKGLYESEMDLRGDELTAWQGEALPHARRMPRKSAASPCVTAGSPAPLLRWHDGRIVALIDEHTAD